MAPEMRSVAEINGSAELIQNKVKFLEDINHIIVHNLRGVAANIKMLVEMLMKSYVNNDEEAARRPTVFSLEQGLSFIGDSSVSLINMLSELMKGIESTSVEDLRYEQCDVAQIINNITLQLNGFIHEKKANVRLFLGATNIEYPKCYMESILYNFISNALKYSRDDVPVEITVSTWRQDGKTVLSVKDNGLGIDLEKYGNRIFNFNQVFHQGYDSKGMGLFITKKQIESLGGTISVKSKVNEGCEFIVVF
jgi:light-regulated signal transduction histidine kinase (bacteriophytochrome)